ncbi:unnamed protein product, partial [Sphacelaria rigidula]
MIVKLEKSIYATKRASRQWSRLLCQAVLEDVGMMQCETHPCVFEREDEGDVRVVLVVHVDDILIGG